jgi:photosystem II stability/assembly factor-like uncharacterized protein
VSGDLERRLREALRTGTLPPAPESLRAALELVPIEPVRPAPVPRRSLAWPVAAALVVVLGALLFSIVGPGRPTPPPIGSFPAVGTSQPVASTTSTTAPTEPVKATLSPTPSTGPTPTATVAPPYVHTGAMAFFDATGGLVSIDMQTGEASESGTMWRTTDAGVTWTQDPVEPGPLFDSMSVSSTGQAWAAVACRYQGRGCDPRGVWHSTDRGRTWQRISPTPVISVTFGDAMHGWGASTDTLAGPNGAPGLLSTTDGGRTWRIRPNPCILAATAPAAVSFTDARRGWVGCSGAGGGTTPKAIMASADGGVTWTVRSSVDGDPRTSVGTIDFADGLIGLAMLPDGSGIWWGDRGTTARTIDGGRTWTAIPLGSFDVRSIAAVALVDQRHWFAVVSGSDDPVSGGGVIAERLKLSSDQGSTWTTVGLMPVPPVP